MVFINFVWTYAGLLCGSKLTDCLNATDTSCFGGIAMATAIVRYATDEKVLGSMVMPRFDFESSFSQMHPLQWAVNRLILHERFGFDTYFAYSSLITQGKADSQVSGRDLSELQTHDIRPLVSSIAVPAYNSWSQYVKNIYFQTETGLAVIPVDVGSDPKFGTPSIPTAKGLLDHVARLNLVNGCLGELSKYQAYLKQNLTSIESSHTCWIPVIVSEVSIADDAFYFELAEYEHPPALIVDVRGNYKPAFETPIQIGSYGVWFIGYRNENWLHQQLRLEVSEDRRSIVNVTFMKQDFGEVPDSVRDRTYADDVAYLRALADEAIENNPIIGKSAIMPAARDKVMALIPCMGGECPIGNLFADAIRWGSDADFSFINSGGIRGGGWPAGDVTMAHIWEALPFANTLCTGKMTGLSLFRLFNFSTSMATYSSTWDPMGDRLLQVSGVRITYNTDLQGSRLVGIDIWDDGVSDYVPAERLRLYKFATDSWMCTGFRDFMPFVNDLPLAKAGEEDGIIGMNIIQNIVGDYLQDLGRQYNTSIQGRLINDTYTFVAMDWIDTEDTCSSGNFWDEDYLTCFPCPSTDLVYFLNEQTEFNGVSGIDNPQTGKVQVTNGENFTVSLILKSKPTWLNFSVPHEDDAALTLLPGATKTLYYFLSTVSLEPGTASRTVSFLVADGGSHPGCIGEDISFDLFVRVDPRPQLSRPGNIRYVGGPLAAVAVFTAFFFAVCILINKKRTVVKAMQPVFLVTLCIGISIMALAIIPLSIEDYIISEPGGNPACMATPWLLSMGFTVVMSTLVAKLWRINKIFNHTLRKVTVKASEAILAFGTIFAINFILLLIWTLVDPLKWTIRAKEGEAWELYGSCADTGTVGLVFFVLTCVFNFCTLCMACYQAYKARALTESVSESKQLFLALGCWVQIMLIGVPVLFLIEHDNSNAQYFVVVAVIFASCMSMMLLIFVPIMFQLRSATGNSGRSTSSNIRISGLTQPGSKFGFDSTILQTSSFVFPNTTVAQEELTSKTHVAIGSEDASKSTFNEKGFHDVPE